MTDEAQPVDEEAPVVAAEQAAVVDSPKPGDTLEERKERREAQKDEFTHWTRVGTLALSAVVAIFTMVNASRV